MILNTSRPIKQWAWCTILVLLTIPELAWADKNKKNQPPPPARPAAQQQRQQPPAQRRQPPPIQQRQQPQFQQRQQPQFQQRQPPPFRQRQPTPNREVQRPPFQQRERAPSQGKQRPPFQPGQRPPNQGEQRPPFQPGRRPPNQGEQRPGLQAGRQMRRPITPPSFARQVRQPDGRSTYQANDGRRWEADREGRITHFYKPGMEAHFDRNGQINHIRDEQRGIVIDRHMHGGQRIITERPDHSRIVSMGRNRGYVERPFDRNGRAYVQRTYVAGGMSYRRVYRTYQYHQVTIVQYVPAVYYPPRFYGWAYDPWGPRVVYSWGWNQDPWYQTYGTYFTPEPAYSSASLWLTDFLLAANLKLAYENQNADNAEQPPADDSSKGAEAASITPEMKQAIAAEVQREIQEEKAESTDSAKPADTAKSEPPPANANTPPPANENAVPPALDPNHRLFVVSSNLDAANVDPPCELTPGDIITRIDDKPGDGNDVRVMVMKSKPTDCKSGLMPSVQVSDLQEMHNSFREQIDRGLGTLAQNQGKNGLPPAPDAKPNAVDVSPLQPDSPMAVQTQLQWQDANANATEEEVQKVAAGDQNNQM
jgi:hypothetical protein